MRLISSANYIPLNEGFENYLQSFDKKEHYNLRSRNKKIQQHGFAFHGSVPLQAAKGIDDLLLLHEVRSAQKGLASTFSNPKIISFHKDFATLIEKNDWLCLRFIGNDKENIAASYNFKYKGRVFSYQKGMAPQWERLGPGKAIVYEAIREAFEQGMKEYNFLQGNEEYKNSWAKNKRGLYNLTLYNRSIPARLSRSMSTMTGVIKNVYQSIKRVRAH
jgi:CelD/BcsL family acetyltransferase involved in cellulose biosynthesis